MTQTYTATQARKNFFLMLKAISTPGVSVMITHEGHPKGVFVSVDEWEGLMETLDILSDPKEVAAIRAAAADKDNAVSLEEFEKSLDV